MAAVSSSVPPTPLGGVRVLDLSKVLAGPLCTQYMADMGADVIKVEAAGQGDDTRGWPPFQDGQAAVFLSCNRNKRSIALDLKSAHGRAVVQRLAAWADVVVHSFGPGVAQKLGVDWEALSEINPRLVYCAISGFGPVGSLSHGKGFDVVLQAFCGMISITGETEGGAVRSPFSPVDQATGLHALIGILAALRQRDASGRGVTVDASLFDTALGFMGYFMQGYWARGTEPARAGAGHESLCPYQDFATADKPIILGIANDALWRAFWHPGRASRTGQRPALCHQRAARGQPRADPGGHARAAGGAHARRMAARARAGRHPLFPHPYAGRGRCASAHARIGHGVRLPRDRRRYRAAQGRGPAGAL
ncbi:CoA-transferase family III protein [Bordetella bronchiseptica E013]|nr:CoA-transferase family III protein [Bordetella bronchiseptica E013]